MKSGAELFLGYYKGKYKKGELTEEQLSQMVTAGTISEDEKQYIMSGGSSGGDTADRQEFYDAVTKEVGIG
ncbi:hypothetical protein [Anaerotignum sp.]|uniref:hypothetical protein n=1 Tax=Anaerotignum sp. TaxID=2039241 RepID=UPI002A9102A2|nr:hypothetical protein [Anaerotignum sp.]MCI7658390.1 hypothetical protein [Clostridia bacterium]MDY5415667.1 hypothetical protein [Anaerotignum sp.]